MSQRDLRLFVGLGNPGSKYLGTRHNIGFMALQKLACSEGTSFRKHKKLHGFLAEVGIGVQRVRLLLPDTFMNESGLSIRAALDWFGIEVDQILVVVDDMDLPLGRLRLRTKGSSGGHNGLKSTINHLGTDHFCRLRIGIGAPATNPQERRSKTVSHVLGNFTNQEAALLDKVLKEVLTGLKQVTQLGISKTATRINSFQPKDLSENQ